MNRRWLKGLFKRSPLKKYKLKKYLKNEWLAAGVHMREKPYPPVWDENGKYLDINVGDILPMFEVEDGLFAYYKITEYHRKRGGDWLYDTDAYDYDLEFSHVGEFKIRWKE